MQGRIKTQALALLGTTGKVPPIQIDSTSSRHPCDLTTATPTRLALENTAMAFTLVS